jgi:hypothetical protein
MSEKNHIEVLPEDREVSKMVLHKGAAPALGS